MFERFACSIRAELPEWSGLASIARWIAEDTRGRFASSRAALQIGVCGFAAGAAPHR